MKVNMYCVYDIKSETFQPPMCLTNDATMRRGFARAWNSSNEMVSMWPEDYKVFCIGIFDDRDGSVDALSKPRFVCTANDILDVEGGRDKLNEDNC